MLCEYGGGNSNLSEIPVLILVLMEDALRVPIALMRNPKNGKS